MTILCLAVVGVELPLLTTLMKNSYLWFQFPSEKMVHLSLVFKDMARRNPHVTNKALPMTPQILSDVHNFMGTSCSEDATYWSLFLFMFFRVARKSNMVPNFYADFDPDKQLLGQDVRKLPNMIVVSTKWSKNKSVWKQTTKDTLNSHPWVESLPSHSI